MRSRGLLLLALTCLGLASCRTSYGQSLHSWYVDPSHETQASHLEWLQSDLSHRDVPGQRLAVAFHLWGLGRKEAARRALAAEAEAHSEYSALARALLEQWRVRGEDR